MAMDLTNKLLLVSGALGLAFQVGGIASGDAVSFSVGLLLWTMYIVIGSYFVLETFTNWYLVITATLFLMTAHTAGGVKIPWVIIGVIPFVIMLGRLAYLLVEHHKPAKRSPTKVFWTSIALIYFIFATTTVLPVVS